MSRTIRLAVVTGTSTGVGHATAPALPDRDDLPPFSELRLGS